MLDLLHDWLFAAQFVRLSVIIAVGWLVRDYETTKTSAEAWG